ncbi:MAG: hypothetical protein AAGI63_11525 [Planctomycetota bacterium]
MRLYVLAIPRFKLWRQSGGGIGVELPGLDPVWALTGPEDERLPLPFQPSCHKAIDLSLARIGELFWARLIRSGSSKRLVPCANPSKWSRWPDNDFWI